MDPTSNKDELQLREAVNEWGEAEINARNVYERLEKAPGGVPFIMTDAEDAALQRHRDATMRLQAIREKIRKQGK